jgi:hypothetical protein
MRRLTNEQKGNLDENVYTKDRVVAGAPCAAFGRDIVHEKRPGGQTDQR